MDALTLQAVIDESHDLNGSQIVAVDQYGATEIGLMNLEPMELLQFKLMQMD